MAETADDVNDDSFLTDDPFEKETETPEVAPSALEKTPESEETKLEAAETEETGESESTDKGETEAPKQTGAEKRKIQLNTEIRDLVAQRNAIKSDVEKTNSEAYQVATESELVGQPIDPDDPESPVYTALEAKVEAMSQERKLEQYNTQVAEAQLTIESEASRVLRDFPMFDKDNKDFNKELSEQASDLLGDYLIKDPNTGQIIGSHVSPYKLFETLANASGISNAQGRIAGQKATTQMLANADGGSSAAPPKKDEDPLAALWSTDD